MNKPTNFGQELSAQLRKLNITDTELARRAGLSQSVISRIRSGARRVLYRRTFLPIIKAISDDPTVRARMLIALIRDRTHDVPGYEHLEFRIRECPTLSDPVNLAGAPSQTAQPQSATRQETEKIDHQNVAGPVPKNREMGNRSGD